MVFISVMMLTYLTLQKSPAPSWEGNAAGKPIQTMNHHWIEHPTILTGELVQLVPLAADHFDELYQAASDKKLWELIPTDCSERENFDKAYHFALSERDKGRQYPFVIVHKATNEMIGSTRFLKCIRATKNWKSAGPGSSPNTGVLKSIWNVNY